MVSLGGQHLPAALLGLQGHDTISSVSHLIDFQPSETSVSTHLPSQEHQW